MTCVDLQMPQRQHSQTQRSTSTWTKWFKSDYAIKSPGVVHSLPCIKPSHCKTFSPLSHSNVQAVEIWCQLRRKAPCSHSHSPPPPQFQRSGKWALLHSPSPLRSPTDSRNPPGSCCLRTGHVKTGPWFWLQPSGDLHTLKGNLNIWWADCRCD